MASMEEKNRSLVLEAFDALFNKLELRPTQGSRHYGGSGC
jgi:hypothetical protein